MKEYTIFWSYTWVGLKRSHGATGMAHKSCKSRNEAFLAGVSYALQMARRDGTVATEIKVEVKNGTVLH